ncbi:uncharacterized protein YozE (UPF0346 family) [Sphingomonas insulae]|uniref:YozE SAM-like domain-containing protein n=2 Tax=Sphingomonas insulae TaxID=424800 RepID=A0ABN1HPJ4_9SPHN|nr:uncharacterized protein YozE (UPF0346 family) [Sphingomonas insulae]
MNKQSVAGGGRDGDMHMIEQNDDDRLQVAFGRWLLTQRNRGDWVDGIAEAARADRTFPREGDPEAVRAHLRKQQADGDAFAAIDDAESDWMAV